MIVVDTNVLAYFLIKGARTKASEAAFQKDPAWVAPVLWRSEFRSVLRKYMRANLLDLKAATKLILEAEIVLQGEGYEPPSASVLQLSGSSICSSYDCEFVSLAQALGIALVTVDGRVVQAFPGTAVQLEAFGRM